MATPITANPKRRAELRGIGSTPPQPVVSTITEMNNWPRMMAANPAPHLRWVKQLLTQNGAETDIKLVQQREGEVLAKA